MVFGRTAREVGTVEVPVGQGHEQGHDLDLIHQEDITTIGEVDLERTAQDQEVDPAVTVKVLGDITTTALRTLKPSTPERI